MSWTSEQLSELRAYAAEHRVVDSDCAMSLIAEVERLRAERQKVADTLWSAAAFVRSWQLCELRHMSDAPSARAACALEQAFRLLSVQTEPPEHKS